MVAPTLIMIHFSRPLIAPAWMNENEMRKNMRLWLDAWTASELPFGQELDPFTGAPSVCSPYYSSTMLFYLYAAKELLGDPISRLLKN